MRSRAQGSRWSLGGARSRVVYRLPAGSSDGRPLGAGLRGAGTPAHGIFVDSRLRGDAFDERSADPPNNHGHWDKVTIIESRNNLRETKTCKNS